METVDRTGTGPARPLLLAHGFSPLYELPTEELAGFYGRHGRMVCFVPHSLSDMTDVVRYAESVRRGAQALAEQTGGRLDLIGLSLGGVAAVYAAKALDLAEYVRTLVTYGSPFHGTGFAEVTAWNPLFLRISRQMMVDSEFLRQLRDRPWPEGLECVSMAGSTDPFCPPTSAALPGARHVVVDYGHLEVITNLDLHRLIEAELG